MEGLRDFQREFRKRARRNPRERFGRFMEHLPENSRRLLLFWPFFGTFAGDFSPAFVAVLVVFLEHLPEIVPTFPLHDCKTNVVF